MKTNFKTLKESVLYVWIIKSLFEQEMGVIRRGNGQGEAGIRKGVRQRCTLSQSGFNLHVQEAAIHKLREEIFIQIRIYGERIDMLRFTDGITVIADNEEDL